MTDREMMQILKEISDDCKEHRICDGCKFYTNEGCALHHFPDAWKLDRMSLSESEKEANKDILNAMVTEIREEERHHIFDVNHNKAECVRGEE